MGNDVEPCKIRKLEKMKSTHKNGPLSKLRVSSKDKVLPQRGLRKALGDITRSQNNSKCVSRNVKLSVAKPRASRRTRQTRAAKQHGTASSKDIVSKEEVSSIEVTSNEEFTTLHTEAEDEAMEVGELEVNKESEGIFWSFPDGVEDIDADDDNPQLCSEYTLKMFVYLRQLESRGSVGPNHLSKCPTSDKMRAVLVDWLVEVQLQFKLLQETLFLTVDIIDRYMAREGGKVSRTELQLIGVAAMFLAGKIEEVFAPACSDFVYITDNAYTEEEIKQTEMKILIALEFNLFQPVSLHFLRRFSKAGDVDVLQHSLAKYALEVGLLDYSLVPTPGSLMAASALFLSLLLLEPGASLDNVWSPTLAFYTGYSREELMPIVTRHAVNLINMPRRKLQAIRTKYKGIKFMKIADHDVMKGETVVQLAKITTL